MIPPPSSSILVFQDDCIVIRDLTRQSFPWLIFSIGAPVKELLYPSMHSITSFADASIFRLTYTKQLVSWCSAMRHIRPISVQHLFHIELVLRLGSSFHSFHSFVEAFIAGHEVSSAQFACYECDRKAGSCATSSPYQCPE